MPALRLAVHVRPGGGGRRGLAGLAFGRAARTAEEGGRDMEDGQSLSLHHFGDVRKYERSIGNNKATYRSREDGRSCRQQLDQI